MRNLTMGEGAVRATPRRPGAGPERSPRRPCCFCLFWCWVAPTPARPPEADTLVSGPTGPRGDLSETRGKACDASQISKCLEAKIKWRAPEARACTRRHPHRCPAHARERASKRPPTQAPPTRACPVYRLSTACTRNTRNSSRRSSRSSPPTRSVSPPHSLPDRRKVPCLKTLFPR